jgi:hypothetical protein
MMMMINRIRTHSLSVQVIKAYASDRTSTETGGMHGRGDKAVKDFGGKPEGKG